MSQKLNYFINVLILVTMSAVFCSPLAGQSQIRKMEAGAQFTVLSICDANGLCDLFPRTEPGFGEKFTYNLNNYFALESEINFYPRDFRKFTTNFTGGPVTEALFGVKAGIRKRKFGVFGKFRPGFESSGHAEVSRFPNGDGPDLANPFGFERIRATQFALDVGGVFEFYPSRRTIIRFDASDIIVRYPGVQFTSFPAGSNVFSTVYSHRPRFSAGFGFRLSGGRRSCRALALTQYS